MTGMGHNQPPLAERLAIDHLALEQQAAMVIALPALEPLVGDEDAEAYSERAKDLKTVAAAIEKARKGEKEQINKDGKTVEHFFAKLAKPVEDAANAIVAAINTHQKRKIAEQEAAEREAAEAARKAATPFDEEVAPSPPPAPASRVVSSATGRVAAFASTVWKYEVTDKNLVPRQFLQINEGAIKAFIAGAKAQGQKVEEVSIPGIRVFSDLRTAIR